MQPSTGEADCLVGYGIGSRTVVDGVYPPWGPYGWGWRRGWGGGWWDAPYVYNEGVIGVDLYDAKSHQAIWHAAADQDLSNLTGEKAERKINDAVNAIFTKYPGTGGGAAPATGAAPAVRG
jgi:hypothetical protein